MTVDFIWIGDEKFFPSIRIEHNPYCAENKCPKHIVFSFGGNAITIRTDEKTLARLAEAIAEHPRAMVKAAQAKLDEQQKEVERLRQLTGDPMPAGG